MSLLILPEPLIIDSTAVSIFKPITNGIRYRADLILPNIQPDLSDIKCKLFH